jgi:hypothetical protein
MHCYQLAGLRSSQLIKAGINKAPDFPSLERLRPSQQHKFLYILFKKYTHKNEVTSPSLQTGASRGRPQRRQLVSQKLIAAL